MIYFKSKFQIGIIIFFAIALTAIALFFIDQRYKTVIVDIPKFSHQSPATSTTENLNSKFIIPNSIFLPVPFTPQAPTANWDELHNEACEEASAIMAYRYFQGDIAATLSPELVEGEIQKLTDWQQQTFGYHLSINSQEVARMIKEVYGLDTEIKTDYTEADIKKALATGKLVLFPANGRLLGNPYYKSPGPIYHMLVIKGYNAERFITNDPGTKRGLNYPYTFDVLYAANGNWDHAKEAVDLSKKNVIVVWK